MYELCDLYDIFKFIIRIIIFMFIEFRKMMVVFKRIDTRTNRTFPDAVELDDNCVREKMRTDTP